MTLVDATMRRRAAGRIIKMTALVAATLCSCRPVAAQWLKQPTINIPRLPNGTPNLTAPTPRTADGKPDFSGLWALSLNPGYLANVLADLEPSDIQPWAEAVFAERLDRLGTDDPGTIGCQPLGPRHITGGGTAGQAKIIQTPSVIIVLFPDLAFRQIFMDGRTLEKNPFPSFEGYSIGHWENDDLVVESNGFKDGTWLDFGGHPHTEALRMVERYRRVDFGHVWRQITIIDPGTLNKPVTIEAEMRLTPDTELLEYICAETPRETFHLEGRTAEQRALTLAPDALAKFIGVYDMEPGATFGIEILNVTLSNGQLFVDFNGKGRIPLVALSPTMFSPRLLGTYEFIVDDKGVVTHLLAHATEGDFKATRRGAGAVR